MQSKQFSMFIKNKIFNSEIGIKKVKHMAYFAKMNPIFLNFSLNLNDSFCTKFKL